MFIPHLTNMANSLPTAPAPANTAPTAAARVSAVVDVTQEAARPHVTHASSAAVAPAANELRAAESAQAAAKDTGAALNAEELQALADQVQEQLQGKARNLLFSVDEDSGRTVVKVVDRQTQEVIKQFPSEEMIALSKALEEMRDALDISGLLDPSASLDPGLLIKQEV